MDPTSSLAVVSLLGICVVVAAGERRRLRLQHEATKQLKESIEIRDKLTAYFRKDYMKILYHLEAGDSAAARAEICTALARTYHALQETRTLLASSSTPGELSLLDAEIREIEGEAQRFDCLRKALDERAA